MGTSTGGSSAGGAPSGSGGTATTGGGGGTGGEAPTGGTGGSGGVTIPEPFDPEGPPFTTKAGLFNQGDTDDLGLSKAPGTETVTIFKPTSGSDHFSNGVVVTAFKGYLYARGKARRPTKTRRIGGRRNSRSQDDWKPARRHGLPGQ